MTLHRRIQLAIVVTLCACSSSTSPHGSTSTGPISVPTTGGTVNLPSAGGYSPTLQIASGAPSGVTITATASTSAPASASVASRRVVHVRDQATAVPILYETLSVSATIAASYFLSEQFTSSSAPSAAGALYYVSIVDVTTGTSLGDFSEQNPGGVTGSVTVHNDFYTETGSPTISFNPGDSYVFEFYYLPLVSVTPFARASVVAVGDTLGLQLAANHGDTVPSQTVQGTWASSNTAVATIDASTGVVTGVSAGTVVMTGTFAGMSGADTLTVTSAGGFSVQTATVSGTDTVVVSLTSGGAFALAAGNTESTSEGVVTVSTSTNQQSLPLTATICQTTQDGQCMAAPTATVSTSFPAGASATYSVFLTATSAITTKPTLTVQFTTSTNQIIGSGSVIIETQQ
jgi:trimeric autotransporter adhesin